MCVVDEHWLQMQLNHQMDYKMPVGTTYCLTSPSIWVFVWAQR